MKAVAIIKEFNKDEPNQWQFDKVMSAIAYDVDLKVIFMPDAISQLAVNKAWKCLSLYGVEDVYFFNPKKTRNYDSLFEIQEICDATLSQYIQQADIIL